MNSANDTNETSQDAGGSRSLTPSIAKLQRIMGSSPTCRMLTPYEIELLRQCAKEVAQVTREVLASKDNT